MLRRRFIAAILLTASLFLVAPPVVYAYETPEEVAQAYVDYSRDHRWTMVAELMEPEMLEGVHQLMLQMFSQVPEGDPDVNELLAVILGPGATRADLETANPVDFTAGLLRLAMTAGGVTLTHGEALGAVYETPELAHVVVRTHVVVYGQFPISSVDVMTVVKTAEGWRISAADQLNALTEILQSLMAQI